MQADLHWCLVFLFQLAIPQPFSQGTITVTERKLGSLKSLCLVRYSCLGRCVLGLLKSVLGYFRELTQVTHDCVILNVLFCSKCIGNFLSERNPQGS